MDKLDPSTAQHTFQLEVERHFRWNFAVNAIDGTLYWLGAAFATPSIILALYVRHLTNSPLYIGLIAAIAGAGWYLPQLLTARYIERLPRKKAVVINLGFFSERLPFLFMAGSALLFAARSPRLALNLMLVTTAWWTLGTGVVAVAWQEMVAKVIPVHYRGRLLGIANFGGTATGLLGASLAAGILARYPFPTNFGLCFALAFVFMMLSWLALSLTREPPLPPDKPAVSLRDYWSRLPAILSRDRNFAYFLTSRVFAVLGRMGMGFLTVYAVDRWRLSDSQAVLYSTVLLAAQAVSNLIFGPMADKRGHKLVLEINLAMSALSMLAALLAPSPAWMYLVYCVVGALTATDILSGIAIVMEFTGPDDRPTYIGLANTIPGLFAVIAPMIGGWLASRTSYGTMFLVASLPSLLAWFILRSVVREPRGAST